MKINLDDTQLQEISDHFGFNNIWEFLDTMERNNLSEEQVLTAYYKEYV